MGTGLSTVTFVFGAAVSLATSWLLVSRLERVGERFGLTEALLGMVAALAADTPEITAALAALARHQRAVGAGVVLGSNVFNLAALLGLGAVVAGRIGLHRKVVLLGGAVAMGVAIACLLTVVGALPVSLGLALTLAVLVPYVVVLGVRRETIRRLPVPERWQGWLASAIEEEELELEEAIRPQRGRPVDVLVAGAALAVVVGASVAMEHAAAGLGRRFNVSEIVVGGLVLAATTSLPNAVAAVHLARRGRGAAALSTSLNSNTLNVVAGLLIPGVVVGLSSASGKEQLAAGWYLGLTALLVALAYADRGLRRSAGWVIIAGYAGFVIVLLAS